MSWKGTRPQHWFHIFERQLGTFTIILGQLAEKMAHALQTHIFLVKIEVQREVGVGGPQLHVNQAVDGGLHLGRIILMNLGAHEWLGIRS